MAQEWINILEDLNAKSKFVDLGKFDSWGWNSCGDAFPVAVAMSMPKLILEVGSWKGSSALQIANETLQIGITDFKIICIDTWLGGVEHVVDYNYREHLFTLYDQFRTNVSTFQKFILPFRQTSSNAARILKEWECVADLIYIDGSHEYEDVLQDLELYWALLKVGGIMFGDDCNAPGVKKALAEFCDKKFLSPLFFPTPHSKEVAPQDYVHWLVQKEK